MKSDPISYLVILRSGPLGRISKDDSQFLKYPGRSSFEARKSAHLG